VNQDPPDTDYHKELKKWQAGSHPALGERQPEELFEPAFAERYRHKHTDLLDRIVDLHGTILTLEMLADFPFDFLYGPHTMEFWHLAWRNFADMALITLHSLYKDSGRDTNTIPKLTKEIGAAEWADPDLYDVYREELRKSKFDKELEDIAKRVETIRHKRVAHRLLDNQTAEPIDQLPGVSLQELRNLFDRVHGLFGAISFGSSYCTLRGDMIPTRVGGKPTKSCLETVLDAVLRDSYAVNEPERRAEWWSVDRQYKEKAWLRTLNDLRRRIGLPEA